MTKFLDTRVSLENDDQNLVLSKTNGLRLSFKYKTAVFQNVTKLSLNVEKSTEKTTELCLNRNARRFKKVESIIFQTISKKVDLSVDLVELLEEIR